MIHWKVSNSISAMASSRRKRSSTEASESDDDDSDSDDDLLTTSVFGATRSSKRIVARDAEAKKQKRMAQMTALLDSGRVNLERESRMDEIHKQNSDVLREENTEGNEKDGNGNGKDGGNKSLERGRFENDRGVQNESKFRNRQPRDTKETLCLGSRNTLRLCRFIPSSATGDSSSPDSNQNQNQNQFHSIPKSWSSFEEAMADFRTLLLVDRQQHQQSSSFASLREELLQPPVTKLHLAWRYIENKLAHNQQHMPADVLRWLMALACGPFVKNNHNGNNCDTNKDGIHPEPTTAKRSARRRVPKVTEKENGPHKTIVSNVSIGFWMNAQRDSYQILHRLWSNDSGFPLQQDQNHVQFLLCISNLPHQLCQWFGSTFVVEESRKEIKIKTNADANANLNASSSSPTPPFAADPDCENKKDSIRVTNTRSSLIQFLTLWALALQKQNESDRIEKSAHLVDFGDNKDDSEGFQSNVSNAIMAVLWIGLDSEFGSSDSARDDCNRYTQTIVQCLLDRVRKETAASDPQIVREDSDGKVSFEEWLLRLSEQICNTWSKKLGRGEKGTDAFEDEHAWFCLARTVSCLDNGGSFGDRKVCDGGERITASTLQSFQLTLSRSILNRAFESERDGKTQQMSKKEEEKDAVTCSADDWVSSSIKEEMQSLNIPDTARSLQSWQAVTLASVGLTKLTTSFPEDEASKCYAVMSICTDCFRLGIMDLQKDIRERCLNETEQEDFEEYDDVQTSTDDASTIPSKGSIDTEVLEKHALYYSFERLESQAQIITNKTRVLIMQNICFSWASQLAESMRNYARLLKGGFAPSGVKNQAPPVKQQAKIQSFFKSN